MACCWHILALLIFISPDTSVAEHVSTRGLAFGFLLWIVHEPLPIFFLVSCLYFRILFRSYFIPLKNNIWILLENTYSMWIKYINNNNKTNLQVSLSGKTWPIEIPDHCSHSRVLPPQRQPLCWISYSDSLAFSSIGSLHMFVYISISFGFPCFWKLYINGIILFVFLATCFFSVSVTLVSLSSWCL